MVFANIEMLWVWVLVFVLLLAAFIHLYYLKRQKQKLFQKSLESYVHKNRFKLISRVQPILSILIAVLLAISILEPKWGREKTEIRQKGRDLLFVIDVSVSMLAEDILPNRLEKAKIQIANFLDQSRGDRIGLVVFAGSAFVSCPLTLDYKAIQLFLSQIDTSIVSQQGTDIGNALATAREAFTDTGHNHQAVILLTDGEDHPQNSLKEAERFARDGIAIFSIGLGNPSGEPIPVKNQDGNLVEYLKDRRGSVVLSKLDELTLKNMSDKTGGRYFFSPDGNLPLEKIQSHLNEIEKREIESQLIENKEDRYAIFTSLAVLLLLSQVVFSHLHVKGRNDV